MDKFINTKIKEIEKRNKERRPVHLSKEDREIEHALHRKYHHNEEISILRNFIIKNDENSINAFNEYKKFVEEILAKYPEENN